MNRVVSPIIRFMEEKKQLRGKLLEARKRLKTDELKRLTELVRQNLSSYLADREFETVHCFEPIQLLGELDVIGLFNNKKLFTSRKSGNEWQNVSAKGVYEVPETYDLIIVPMLAFDASLNRIGYGGGYYDQFLATQPDALKVGVCLEQGRVENLPVEAHDIPLDAVITEKPSA